MLHDMDNMEARGIYYVKVGILTHLEECKLYLLTVNTTGIVRLTVNHDFHDSVSLMYHPADYLRQTSVAILSLKQCQIYV
jgi:hypothetical protein